jgi:hypothetical protein
MKHYSSIKEGDTSIFRVNRRSSRSCQRRSVSFPVSTSQRTNFKRLKSSQACSWPQGISPLPSSCSRILPRRGSCFTRHLIWILLLARNYWEALHPYSAGGAHVNFMMGEEGEARVKASYRDNYAHLATIKAKYDPTNFFRVNQNIKPAP